MKPEHCIYFVFLVSCVSSKSLEDILSNTESDTEELDLETLVDEYPYSVFVSNEKHVTTPISEIKIDIPTSPASELRVSTESDSLLSDLIVTPFPEIIHDPERKRKYFYHPELESKMEETLHSFQNQETLPFYSEDSETLVQDDTGLLLQGFEQIRQHSPERLKAIEKLFELKDQAMDLMSEFAQYQPPSSLDPESSKQNRSGRFIGVSSPKKLALIEQLFENSVNYSSIFSKIVAFKSPQTMQTDVIDQLNDESENPDTVEHRSKRSDDEEYFHSAFQIHETEDSVSRSSEREKIQELEDATFKMEIHSLWSKEIEEKILERVEDLRDDFLLNVLKEEDCLKWSYEYQSRLVEMLPRIKPQWTFDAACKDLNISITNYLVFSTSTVELIDVMMKAIYRAKDNEREGKREAATFLHYLNPQITLEILEYFVPLPGDVGDIFAERYNWRRPYYPTWRPRPRPNPRPQRRPTKSKLTQSQKAIIETLIGIGQTSW